MFPGTTEYGVEIDVDQRAVDALLEITPAAVEPAESLTFARNVFLPLTTACRYTCTYCTFYDPPGEATLMTPAEIRRQCRRAAEAGCTEALFTFGDEPDDRYTRIYEGLEEFGHDDVLEYLYRACEIALEEGLLPHSNPGDLTEPSFRRLREVNASMGVMLETTADVRAHGGSRRKSPGQRLATIRDAGRAGVPFTTGILVGIGETWRDRAESLLAIRELHERHGHVQEVIVQNVVPNERSDFERPGVETMRRAVAMARAALPPSVSVQVPPNLSPTRELLDCGVDDLGGVSPVTDDYVNPEYEWPALSELREIAATADVPLFERLPTYGRYLPRELRGGLAGSDGPTHASDGDPSGEWIHDRIRRRIERDDVHGRRLRRVGRGEERVDAGGPDDVSGPGDAVP
ncbi:MAG: 7,8-didemethyl-8-hydroxy-5-deazariboflavin synthase subunit CofG [Haloferacaceae archaeon]